MPGHCALIIATLAATACKLGGGGGGGGQHGGGGGGGGLGGGGGAFSCTSGTTHKGDQVGGGDSFGWCVDHSSNAFSIADLTTSSATTNGGLTFNVSYNNLLNFTASADSGAVVEMPGTQLLVNPCTLLTGVGQARIPFCRFFNSRESVLPPGLALLRPAQEHLDWL